MRWPVAVGDDADVEVGDVDSVSGTRHTHLPRLAETHPQVLSIAHENVTFIPFAQRAHATRDSRTENEISVFDRLSRLSAGGRRV